MITDWASALLIPLYGLATFTGCGLAYLAVRLDLDPAEAFAMGTVGIFGSAALVMFISEKVSA